MSRQKIKPFKFKSKRSDITYMYSLIKIDWPVSEEVIAKLSAFMFTYIPDDVACQAKISPMVEKALLQYNKSVSRQLTESIEDYERIAAFVSSLIDQVSEFLLDTYKNEGKSVVIDEQAIASLRASIYEVLITESLQRVFKTVKNEKKILALCGSFSN